MKLYLMRHCQSQEGPEMDASRGLIPEGVEQGKTMKRFRKALGIKWDVVFTSDFARAIETADLVANKKADRIELKELEPLGTTTEKAYAAMHKAYDITDDTHVLVVTHHPFIEQMAAAVCFSFDPSHNAFSHGTMMRFDTHRIPPDKHPLHWLVRPSLVESMEDGELIEAAIEVRESLAIASKAAIVDPMIARLRKALARRFRAQARQYKRTGNFSHPDLDADLHAALIAGAAHVHSQLGGIQEADSKKPPLPPWLVAALGATVLDRNVLDIERDIDETSADLIAKLVANGASQDDIAAKIAAWAQDRAESIATTEISTAFHQGGSDAAKLIGDREGVLVQKAWNVEEDPCEECLGNLDDGWIDEDVLFASGDDAPPAHPNCLPGDCVVSAAGISAVSKRWFEGELISIGIAQYGYCAITPNHPVLTGRGWIEARSLEVGDELVQCLDPRSAVALLDPDDNDIETCIEEIANAPLMLGSVLPIRVPASAEAFHGEGTNGEIDIVRPAGSLPPYGEARESFIDALFRCLHLHREGFPGSSPQAQLTEASADASYRAVGSVTQSEPLLSTSLGHSQKHGFAGIARPKPSELEPSHNGRSRNTEPLRESLDRFTGLMSRVKISSIGKSQFSGHVYNLETTDGFYLANSIVVHNCRCSLSYRTSGDEG